MRARLRRSRVSHDRWLVSYADFITLLFAFFVVLYAFSKAEQKKQQQVSRAIDSAFQSLGVLPNGGRFSTAAPATKPSLDGPSIDRMHSVITEEIRSPKQVQDDLERMRRELEQTLSTEIADHSLSVQLGRDGLVIRLREAGFFDSGSAQPKSETRRTLRRIDVSLSREPYDLRVEGHTDDQPIHNAQFDSNWELSSARATRIARILLEFQDLSPDRLSAAGYAEFRPIASNKTVDGRAENRRVDLVVMPRIRFNFPPPQRDRMRSSWRRITDDQPEDGHVTQRPGL